ncbi:NAD(P)-dependent oxidoreductase [Aerococcaceae bacterium WGS1372]
MEISYFTLYERLTKAHIVSLYLPLLQTTKGLISAEKLQLMKVSVILINCSRGTIVDNATLADALNEGKIGGTVIDMFDMEPNNTC